MGRLPTGDRKYEISKMWDVHHEIVRLAACGAKEVDIAAILNVTPAMVSYTLNSAIVKRQLALVRAARDVDSIDIAKRIHEIALVAVEKLALHVDSPDDKVSLAACRDILDRDGHGAVKRMQVDSRALVLTAEDIADIKKRAQDLAAENGMLIEATAAEA